MKKIIILLTLAIMTSPVTEVMSSNSTSKTLMDYAKKGYSTKLLFPIDVASNIVLKADSPVGFQLAHNDTKEMKGDLSISIFEFIPEKESIHNWSQIVTYQCMIGFRLNVNDVGKNLYNRVASLADKGSVSKPEFTFVNANGYEIGKLSFTYRTQGKKEIFVARIYSGRYDTVVQQHTIRPDRIKGTDYNKHFANSLKAYQIISKGKAAIK